MRFRHILLSACMGLYALPAQADILTYTFYTIGSGSAYAYPGVIDPFTPITLTNAKFVFTVDTDMMFPGNRGGTDLLGSMVNGYADATSLYVNANQQDGPNAFSGAAGICFSNPGSGFVLQPAFIQSTCQSRMSASGYGSTNGLFNYDGVVTALQVSLDGYGGGITRVVNGVPEPSTWALMLAGFGMVGYAIRRRKLAFA